MKKITLLTLALFSVLSYAQVGINTDTPDSSSALDIESTTGGILIPRLTEIQRDAIGSPATGLMIYQTDQTTGFYFYNGTAWTRIEGVAGPQGEQGPQGPQGETGAAGTNGTNGSDGADGADGKGISSTVDNGDGTFTITYTDNTTFTTSDFTGPQGPQGETGAAGTNGTNGSDGADGADGKGISSTVDNGDGTFTITYTDNTTFTTSDFTGPQGPQGETGAEGFTSLINTEIEPAGNNCEYGGVKLEFGFDLNENNLLDNNEINQDLTQFVCAVTGNNNLTLQEQLDLGTTPWQLIDRGVLKSSLYGKNYKGGLIIYIDEINQSGMVITDFILRSNVCPPNNNIDYNTSTAIGSGMSNSTSIGSDWNYGALLCLNLVYQGYDDWFLPSVDELILAFQNIPNFGGEYWTSSQTITNLSVNYWKFVRSSGAGQYSPDSCNPDIKAVRVFN